ncbi:signal peptidase I [Enterococcus sp. HY326]|uniref:signal peptidase I n=1 Tax=Enterococcus sp. HY326 TaxID=2971265 RepID=UPI00223E91F6|nr:signal peptidase I [Enterococcus sp. HY326]
MSIQRTSKSKKKKSSKSNQKSLPTNKAVKLSKSGRRNVSYQKKSSSKKKRRRSKKKHIIQDFFYAIVMASLLALILFFFLFKIVVINGYSMMPTLRDQDTVLIRKTDYVKRFNLIYFQQGNTQQVRRVVGLPGERIDYKEDTLFVNGESVEEKFLVDDINDAQRNGGQYTPNFTLLDITNQQTIPDDCYLVLADNRSYGSDSRQYGLVTRNQIIGVLQTLLLPLTDTKKL